MLLHKLKFAAMTLMFVSAIAAGAGYLTHALARGDEPGKAPAVPPSRVAERSDDGPDPGRMIIAGRVVDPQGKPVPDAGVMVYAVPKQNERPVLFESPNPLILDQGRCDGSGRFRFDVPRTSRTRDNALRVTALAPGYGIGWVALDADAEHSPIDVPLRPEVMIRGRLFDSQSQPAQGVEIAVRSILRTVHGTIDGLGLMRHHGKAPHGWPAPATTDADGRFILRGLGRELWATLGVDDLRFASQIILIDTDGTLDSAQSPYGPLLPKIKVGSDPDSKPLVMALRPAQIITGRVTYADTGKPVPHAPIAASSIANVVRGARSTDFQADAEGRFRINPSSGDQFNLMTQSPDGQPYLIVSSRLDWPRGAIEQSVDLRCPEAW